MFTLKFIIERIKSSFWLVPLLFLLISFLCAIGSIYIDHQYLSDIKFLPPSWDMDRKTLQSIFSTVAGSTIGVLGVTFSVTITTLVLATQQFGPHLIRMFMDRPIVQIIIGSYIGATLYSLTCLFSMSLLSEITPVFSAGVLFLSTIINLFLLVAFIHQSATAIQVEEIINSVHSDFCKNINFMLEAKNSTDDRFEQDFIHECFLGEEGKITATKTGYIQNIEYKKIAEDAYNKNIVVRALIMPGDHIIEGQTIMATSNKNTSLNIDAYLKIGAITTKSQDIRYPINQLVEMALRALSPGVNDPYTAKIALAYITAMVIAISNDKPQKSQYIINDQLCLIRKNPTLSEIINIAFQEIRTIGGSQYLISDALFTSYRKILNMVDRNDVDLVLLKHVDAWINELRFSTPLERQRIFSSQLNSLKHELESRLS